jgi:hypothetical protein
MTDEHPAPVPLPIGRLLPRDAQGHLLSDAHADRIPTQLQPLTGLLVGLFQDEFGDDLHSVYARGSIVRGHYRPGFSDILTWAVRRDGPPEFVVLDHLEGIISAQFDELAGVEMAHVSLEGLQRANPFTRMLLSTQSACLHGASVLSDLGRFRAGPDTWHACLRIRAIVDDLLANGSDAPGEDMAWLCTQVVRAGLECHAAEHGQYTRDLYPCYAMFSAFHPEHAALMWEVFCRAVDPIDDARALKRLARQIRDELVPLLHVTP